MDIIPRAVRRMNPEHGLALALMTSNSGPGLALAGRFQVILALCVDFGSSMLRA